MGRRLAHICLAALAIPVGMAAIDVGYAVLGGVGTPEVRLDSGDRRWRLVFFAIPEARVPGRDRLIAASKELGIPRHWCPVRRRAPSHPDAARHFLYSRTAFWLEAEPALGKRILSDIADYFRNPDRYDGYPPSAAFVFAAQWGDQDGKFELNLGWVATNAEAMRCLLDEIAYTPDPNGPIASHIRALPPE